MKPIPVGCFAVLQFTTITHRFMAWIISILAVVFLVSLISAEVWAVIGAVIVICLAVVVINQQKKKKQREEIQKIIGLSDAEMTPDHFSYPVKVMSRATLDKYDTLKFFKEQPDILAIAKEHIETNKDRAHKLEEILNDKNLDLYSDFRSELQKLHKDLVCYRVLISYQTKKTLSTRNLYISMEEITEIESQPHLLIGKTEYNRQLKQMLADKQHEMYDRINSIIDVANESRDHLILKGSQNKLDGLIAGLFSEVVSSVRKIKSVDSLEWELIEKQVGKIEREVEDMLGLNKKILDYYESPDFERIKNTCQSMINSQKEFNDYIKQKVESISKLFGKRTLREETVFEDKNQYVRAYKKTVAPFTAQVSAQVFSSAENNPMGYLVKTFYPNKAAYPQQIQDLYKLVEELETLRDAKEIIENYKTEYKQYIGNVPDYVMDNDSDGFYSRLGFAQVDESTLTVEYVFTYTSSGGKAQRSFSVPMTLETIEELINTLKSKLTKEAFIKEQRLLMTPKLRETVKERDLYTCCMCGNSITKEPNLLLEIDHIIPVSKGGETIPSNLQTLCWKCNRSKSNKILHDGSSE
ncbi:HNH endonuclease [Parasutterella secunda]|uniref:HNH endonuclease n=1 Tax=Parasutterella secunda TaxID=626947 RepID=UPI00201315C7|nr:HNH endonuclease signature motif containing protein [Parasutterella secunda]MCL1595850.1 HNH endonuclease [Parasutterella secunda]